MTTSGNLIQDLSAANVPLLKKYDPYAAIKMLDMIEKGNHYHHISDRLVAIWHDVLQEFGSVGFGAFQKLVMLYLMEDFQNRASHIHYVEEVLQCFEFSFARIKKSIEDPECTDYDSENDILFKDLALCRQVMFPAGAEVVSPHTGFSRTIMFRGGVKQFWSTLRLLLKTGGNTGYYSYHTHLRELDYFNPRGWDKFYLRIADMLKANPEVRGLTTSTWFLDPALKAVSPNLAYIREQPELNGAMFFLVGVTTDTGALSKSATRRRLYDEGKYIPKSYSMVWPRKDLIEWAERFREEDRGIIQC